jgi:hypothetical protein
MKLAAYILFLTFSVMFWTELGEPYEEEADDSNRTISIKSGGVAVSWCDDFYWYA